MSKKIFILLLLALSLLIGCEPIEKNFSEQKVYITTDKTEYYTNSTNADVILVDIYNNLNESIFYLTGCAVQHLHLYVYENNTFKEARWKKIVCGGMPQVNTLPPGKHVNLGFRILNEGRYKLKFPYVLSMHSMVGGNLLNAKEEATNEFVITYANRSIESCFPSDIYFDSEDNSYLYYCPERKK